MKKLVVCLLLAVICCLSAADYAVAANITVTNTNDALTGSLRQAIANAADNDVITFNLPPSGPGYDAFTGKWTINLTSGELEINKNLTINGPGVNKLTLQRSGSNVARIFLITANATATVSGLTVTNGLGNDISGGGIFNFGTLTLNNSTVSGNSARSGGGIYNAGTLTITNSTVANNNGSYGGGLINRGTLTLINSTLSNNTGEWGGAVNNGGPLTVTNSTISGNRATWGGGLYNLSTATVTNSTIADNRATWGGGIHNNNEGTLVVGNSILANNTGDGISEFGPNCYGPLDSHDYNLIDNTSRCVISGPVSYSHLNVPANLGPLLDNGGPTKTHAIQGNSVAIDAGQ